MLLQRFVDGSRGPTLRLWAWAEPALVVGSNQVVANEVDLDQAAALGFRVVRRISGGGTMLVEPGRTVTYSMILPERAVAGMSFVESFRYLDAWAVECLRGMGVPADYRPVNDIVSPQGKIGGAAQARRRRAVLHHTTIAFHVEQDLVERLIRIGRERVSPRGVRSAEKVVSPLSLWLGGAAEGASEALAACFEAGHRTVPGAIGVEELAAARDLAAGKHASEAWIFRLR